MERMVKEAESYAAEDKKHREQVDAKNMADSLAYQSEKQLQDLGDKVPAADRNRVEGLVKDLREAINRENYDRIKLLTDELRQALMQVGSAVYAQAGAGPSVRTEASGPGEGDEDVIDAEVVDDT